MRLHSRAGKDFARLPSLGQGGHCGGNKNLSSHVPSILRFTKVQAKKPARGIQSAIFPSNESSKTRLLVQFVTWPSSR